MSITIKNLSKNYGTEQALKSINLSIKKGEIVGLLGVNGAGKSTLMKSICGVLEIQEGEVKVNGFDVKENSLVTKHAIGFLSEDNPLYKDMNVGEYLNFVAEIKKTDKKNISTVLSDVGLSDKIDQKIKNLSKGYKQRVGIAQAILNNPDIIILDEPTSGLDPNQITEIRELIKKLGKDKTVLLSTHIMQEVEEMCSRIVFIHQGEIIANELIDYFLEKYKSLEVAFKVLSKRVV